MAIKVISLFSGCGGLDLGFKKEGFDIVWSNDKVEDACTTHRKNIGDHIVCGDLNVISVESIPSGNILIGGPPCQSFSLLGRRKPEDERGDLAWKYLEILEEKRPQLFLFENVLGMISAQTKDGHNVLDRLRNLVHHMGYRLSTYTLNAADYGVPQRRRRVFIVGSLNGKEIECPSPTHRETSERVLAGRVLERWISSREALSDLPKPSAEDGIPYATEAQNEYQRSMREKSNGVYNHYPPYASEKDMQIIRSVPPGGNYMDVPNDIATKRIMKFKQTGGRTTTYGRLDPEKPAYTINTYFDRPNVGCNIHYSEDRMITIREGLRLQSFSDDFIVYSNSKRNYYLQVGNAVPPLLAQAWARKLKEYI
jgi:DNA (cytosine-5)-methyltransferase 1